MARTMKCRPSVNGQHCINSWVYTVHIAEHVVVPLILLLYLNFQPLEVVSRYRDPQPQVVENYCLIREQPFTNIDV